MIYINEEVLIVLVLGCFVGVCGGFFLTAEVVAAQLRGLIVRLLPLPSRTPGSLENSPASSEGLFYCGPDCDGADEVHQCVEFPDDDESDEPVRRSSRR